MRSISVEASGKEISTTDLHYVDYYTQASTDCLLRERSKTMIIH